MTQRAAVRGVALPAGRRHVAAAPVWPCATDAIQREVQIFAETFTRFTNRIGDRLLRERRDLFERLFDAAPGLLGRYATIRSSPRREMPSR